MKTRSKMILGLASLLGVTAGATAVSGFAWFVTTKTATIDVTNIGVYNNNPSLSVTMSNLAGVTRTNDAANDFDLAASKDTTYFRHTATGNGTLKTFELPAPGPKGKPTAYINGTKTNFEYASGTRIATFEDAPEANAEILFEYYEAALTDVSSNDGINIYDPVWQTAYEGTKATKVKEAVAGTQYISFDLTFAPAESGSLDVLLDRPKITAKTSSDPDKEAADVARVAFSIGETNVLTLSNKADYETAGVYDQGISKNKVTTANATTDGDYTITNLTETCQNLVKPSLTDYSVLSSTPGTDPEDMYITNVADSPVTVHVAIWLEGTAHVDNKGNNSVPIGGEINVQLNLVAFSA